MDPVLLSVWLNNSQFSWTKVYGNCKLMISSFGRIKNNGLSDRILSNKKIRVLNGGFVGCNQSSPLFFQIYVHIYIILDSFIEWERVGTKKRSLKVEANLSLHWCYLRPLSATYKIEKTNVFAIWKRVHKKQVTFYYHVCFGELKRLIFNFLFCGNVGTP